jgi:hypothetical protein
VGGDAGGDVHADRGDLALLDPHARELAALLRAATRGHAHLAQSGDQSPLQRRDVLDDVVDAHDRVADQLPRPVVGHLAAAVGLDDVEALHPVPVLTHRELARDRAPSARVDRPVLEHQQDVRDSIPLARRGQPALERERLAVIDRPEVAHPELSGHARGPA